MHGFFLSLASRYFFSRSAIASIARGCGVGDLKARLSSVHSSCASMIIEALLTREVDDGEAADDLAEGFGSPIQIGVVKGWMVAVLEFGLVVWNRYKPPHHPSDNRSMISPTDCNVWISIFPQVSVLRCIHNQ